jgi:hypothetical protein
MRLRKGPSCPGNAVHRSGGHPVRTRGRGTSMCHLHRIPGARRPLRSLEAWTPATVRPERELQTPTIPGNRSHQSRYARDVSCRVCRGSGHGYRGSECVHGCTPERPRHGRHGAASSHAAPSRRPAPSSGKVRLPLQMKTARGGETFNTRRTHPPEPRNGTQPRRVVPGMPGQRPRMAAVASAYTDVRPSGHGMAGTTRLLPKPQRNCLCCCFSRRQSRARLASPTRTALRPEVTRPRDASDASCRACRGSGHGWPR